MKKIGIFKSIRTRLFLSLCIIVITIIVSLILLNNFVLREFYQYNKEKQLKNVYKTINDYYNKRIQAQAEEAKILALKYFERYGKRPEKNIFHEYFMLFSKRDDILKDSLYLEKAKLCENFQESIVYIEQNPPLFENFKEFLRYCFDEK